MMGVLQAQDFGMAKWAVGVRLPGSTEKEIENAMDKGEILRTHLLRSTWHLVTAEDIYWMLDLGAARTVSSSRSRHKELELTETVFRKSNAVIEKALAKSERLTRDELVRELGKAKIATNDNRAAHLFGRAESDGIICSGMMKGKKQTFALLERRVPKRKRLSREESLAKLAGKYFSSHGPATLQDFIWWSGLKIAEARHALEMVKTDFVPETIGSQTYWFMDSISIPDSNAKSVYLLPAFDEFLIGYTDRTASVSFDNHKKSVSNNGIFRPVIVINGQVTGMWQRTIEKDDVHVETEFFRPHSKEEKKSIHRAAEKFGKFLGKKTELNRDSGV
jgi:DNA glycosylase AlkZ-like